jgi:hypothetical protein
MQASEYARIASKGRKKCNLKFSTTKQLKRARIGEIFLFRVQEGDNTDTMKTWVFKNIELQPYIGRKENLEIVSETFKDSSSFEHKGRFLHSK